ncbi:TonB-dependent receptor [Paucibacter sp. APW11]|uniref:TonB-dependent receptor n=1 Tax=Roseateles aquae TaxID=3077235 RepID=A0ABU3PGE5_9BURK|nr:TonB-dependent receptor [Paucibacter sp. APW11]MDT9001036.1 TonB-dependent receptor [Paucibacter sp. APW11]
MSTLTSPQCRLRLLSLSLLAAFEVQAQTATLPPGQQLDAVVVTGQSASLRKAIKAQAAADNVVSVVSADDIGSLPDINASEALARMPGLSVQRDQGEGRYVSVRGLGPDLNSVTINGALVPAPENGRRGVSLDVLPAGLVRSLEVAKTLTPEMDANSLGGSIEVKTLSAFDLPDRLLSATVGASHDTLLGKSSPFASALWADRLAGGTLGIAVGLSGERRKFASDDVESGGAWTANGRMSGVELRDYLPVRDRQALGLNLDLRPNDRRAFYLRGFVSHFSDDEVRDRLTIGTITGGSAAEGQTFTGRVERRLRDRKYTRMISSLVLGGEQTLENWKISAALGHSKADEDQPNALNDVQFRQNNMAGLSFTDSTRPQINGPAGLYDTSAYKLNAITFQERFSRDQEKHAKLDVSSKHSFGEAETLFKVGAKLSRRSKSNDTDQWAFSSATASSPNYWGAGPMAMSSFLLGSELDFPQRIGLGIDPALVRARVQGLDRRAATNVAASTINDWTMNENIDSLYAQASTNWGNWTVLAGLRRERTAFDAAGSQIAVNGSVTPRKAGRSYANTLPNLQARYDIDNQTSVRAALTQAVVRANFSQLAPGVTLASPTEASIGNPDLKPLRAHNVDLGVERLLGSDGNLSLYLFNKDIKDFSYTTNLAGSAAWAGYTTATMAVNGDSASVKGLELSYSQALRQLPGWMGGLIVGANATFTDSKSKLSRFDKAAQALLSREVALPGQSDRVINLMLGYETGAFSGRIAANAKSRYLLQTGADVLDTNADNWVDAQTQLDLSLKYKLTPRLQLNAEVLNLTREKYYVYLGSKPFNVQNEQYGRSFRLSLTASVF